MKRIQITAVHADELMVDRKRSQACLGYAELRQKKIEVQKIRKLYETAFPEDEQIPWEDLLRLVREMPLDFTAYYDGEVKEQRRKRQAFYTRNGFRDTNVYRTYRSAQRDACQSKNDITMTIMMRGEGAFTMHDWDDLIHELQQFWWPDEIKEK